MSIAMALKNERICPLCGKQALRAIELHDENYAKRNGIPMPAVDQISEDGTFYMDVCVHCGFKHVQNTAKASTSQIFSLLLHHYIEIVYKADPKEMDSIEADFCAVSGKKYARSAGLLHQKLRFIRNLSDYMRSCSVDELLEIYNQLTARDLEELYGVTVAGIPLELPDKSKLKSMEMLADD